MDELLDDAPSGFLIFSDEGVITQANRTVTQLLGRKRDELVGQKFESLLSIAGRIFYQTHFFPLLSLQGKAEEIFLTLLAADRAEVPVLLNAHRKPGAAGHENHCSLIPVYQRKKFEAELVQARRTAEEALSKSDRLQELTAELERSKQELDRQITQLSVIHDDLAKFSKIISHDMQEPTRKILLFADIIERENAGVLNPTSKQAISRIKSATDRMRDLIQSLQQYVMIDKPNTRPEPCDLSSIVASAKEKALSETEVENVIINSKQLPIVEGHCDQFSLLFYHLISNSIQFRREDKATEITIAYDSVQQNRYRSIKGKYHYTDFAQIIFSDNGKGFGEEYADYIFHLFEKGSSDSPGMGFGLALCKKIVENHSGSITARSAEGKGASFTILLPVKYLGVGVK